jgi:arylsulfatase A-like enzyme
MSKFNGVINDYIEDSIPDFEQPSEAPENAPNVVYIVLDDLGFSHLGAYGSDISTPHIDQLANGGLKYSNFHTTAICSPTRASLLTGRNHHKTGINVVSDLTNGFPNGRGKVSKETALISEVLKENGYNTIAVGKWHLLPGNERTATGPFDEWPLQRGFEKYYGFLGGETSQWNPDLVHGNEYIEQPKTAAEGYHLTEDLTDKAIRYIREQKSADNKRPFFLYYALGAVHAPHHAPKEFIDKYKGKFDEGWDVVRERWFNRQKELGIIPADTQLPPSNPGVKPWNELTDNEKKWFARLQEAFAGFLEHTDYQIGRLLNELKTLDIYDDTVIVLVSDNGASPEGLTTGTWNEHKNFNGEPVNIDEDIKYLDKIGTEYAYNHYPHGWAQAGNTPLKWYKTFVHAGGVKDPFIISYPKRIKATGEIRHQYHHVIDVFPTILELTNIEVPEYVNHIQQQSIDGTSLVYSFDKAEAPGTRTTQYYEMLGNRAIYHDGWKAVAHHRLNTSFDEDRWELYHVAEDFSESNDLADVYPEKLQELIAIWWEEARKYNVLPLDGRGLFHRISHIGATADVIEQFYPPVGGFHHYVTWDVTKEHTITIKLHRKSTSEQGTLIADGGRFGGWAIYVKDNKAYFVNNYVGEIITSLQTSIDLPLGDVILTYHFEPTGGRGGRVTAYINDQQVGAVDIPKRGIGPGAFAIGKSVLTPVVEDIAVPNTYSGEIQVLTVRFPAYNKKQEEVLQALKTD